MVAGSARARGADLDRLPTGRRRAAAPIVSGIELIPVSKKASAPVGGSLTLRASGDQLISLTGRLRLRGAKPGHRLISIEILMRRGRDFETVAIVRVRSDGSFSLTFGRRSDPVQVRASFAGDGAAQPEVSRVLSVG